MTFWKEVILLMAFRKANLHNGEEQEGIKAVKMISHVLSSVNLCVSGHKGDNTVVSTYPRGIHPKTPSGSLKTMDSTEPNE